MYYEVIYHDNYIVMAPSPHASENTNYLRKQKVDAWLLSVNQEAIEPKPVNHGFHFWQGKAETY